MKARYVLALLVAATAQLSPRQAALAQAELVTDEANDVPQLSSDAAESAESTAGARISDAGRHTVDDPTPTAEPARPTPSESASTRDLSRAQATDMPRAGVGSSTSIQLYIRLSGGGSYVVGEWTDYRQGYIGHGVGLGLGVGLQLLEWLAVEVDWRLSFHQHFLQAARVTPIVATAMRTNTISVGPRLELFRGPRWSMFAYGFLAYSLVAVTFDDCPNCDQILTQGWGGEVGVGMRVALSPNFDLGARVGVQMKRYPEDSFESRFRFSESEDSLVGSTVVPAVFDLLLAYRFR